MDVLGFENRPNFTEAKSRTLDLYQTPANFLLDEYIFDNTLL
jgi:hypothetical protein